MNIDAKDFKKQKRTIVTSKILGKVMVSNAVYENLDEASYIIQIDYFGEKTRNKNQHLSHSYLKMRNLFSFWYGH